MLQLNEQDACIDFCKLRLNAPEQNCNCLTGAAVRFPTRICDADPLGTPNRTSRLLFGCIYRKVNKAGRSCILEVLGRTLLCGSRLRPAAAALRGAVAGAQDYALPVAARPVKPIWQ